MADLKISDTKMEETIVETKVITHDLEDLLKRRQEAVEQAAMYTAIVNDFDILIARMKRAGCCETMKEEDSGLGKIEG